MKNAVTITPWKDEEHIVSVVVHVHKQHTAVVENVMDSLPGVERMTQDDKGKYVLVISAESAKKVMQQIEAIQDVEGVLNAAMIAHHTESTESLNEHIEISDVLLKQTEELQKDRRIQ
jgi:nitrate reductase NapD